MQIRFIFIFIFIVAACTPNAIPTSTPTLNQSKPTMMPTPFIPSPSSLQNLIEKATEDLARRLSVPTQQIQIVEAREVVWPNSSLGCPQKGMVYADVLTPGYLIILQFDNREYEYHSSKGTEVIYCQNPTPPVPDIPGDI